MTSSPIAVLDLDGVLADVRHRLRCLERSPKDWERFFAGIPADPPLAVGVALLTDLVERGHEIVYLTGRPERTRTATAEWLSRQGLPQGPVLMRRDDDHRPAAQVKLGLLRRALSVPTVAVVVDDDPNVCSALRAAGWPVLFADWVERPEVLARAQERGAS